MLCKKIYAHNISISKQNKWYNMPVFQTCDACFKKFEPLIQKLMDNFNNTMTQSDQTVSNNVSSVKTPSGEQLGIN